MILRHMCLLQKSSSAMLKVFVGKRIAETALIADKKLNYKESCTLTLDFDSL
jgi:hypothetical protein